MQTTKYLMLSPDGSAQKVSKVLLLLVFCPFCFVVLSVLFLFLYVFSLFYFVVILLFPPLFFYFPGSLFYLSSSFLFLSFVLRPSF